jgi:Na+/melibiose symporter-like transporter
MPTNKSLLTRAQLLAFALPAMPLSAMHSPITVYLPPFYAGQMGLGLSTVGVVFMLARFWDVFTDPVFGVVTDNFPSRFGRRRHWLVISVPILLVSAFFVFLPRVVVGESATAFYLLSWLFVLYIGYTLATLSQFSWAAELTGNYHGRSQILGWWEFARFLGMFTVLAAPAFIEQTGHETTDSDRVAAMGWYIIILLPITVFIAVMKVPERGIVDPVRVPWYRGLALIAKNKLMLRVLVADLMIGVHGGLMGALYVFFIVDVIHSPKWVSLVLLGFFFAGLFGIPLTVRLSYTIGKHRALIACLVAMMCVTIGFWFLGPGDLLMFTVLIALAGLVFNGMSVLLRAVTADITDYDNLETGSARTGLFFAVLTMTNKVGYALAVGISYPFLDWVGFEPGGNNGPEAIDALRIAFVFFPIIALVAAAVVMYGFPLNVDRQRELRAQVEARDAQRLSRQSAK